MDGATAFFSDGSEVIQRSISVDDTLRVNSRDLHSVYEIPRCVEFINSNDFKKVSVIFKDRDTELRQSIELMCVSDHQQGDV